MPGTRSRRYLVSGVVQGVGFRWFIHKAATRLGVTGWARNLPDGRVEAAGRGSEGQLDAFEVALRSGPAGADVTNLQASDTLDEVDGHDGFEIRQ